MNQKNNYLNNFFVQQEKAFAQDWRYVKLNQPTFLQNAALKHLQFDLKPGAINSIRVERELELWVPMSTKWNQLQVREVRLRLQNLQEIYCRCCFRTIGTESVDRPVQWWAKDCSDCRRKYKILQKPNLHFPDSEGRFKTDDIDIETKGWWSDFDIKFNYGESEILGPNGKPHNKLPNSFDGTLYHATR